MWLLDKCQLGTALLRMANKQKDKKYKSAKAKSTKIQNNTYKLKTTTEHLAAYNNNQSGTKLHGEM